MSFGDFLKAATLGPLAPVIGGTGAALSDLGMGLYSAKMAGDEAAANRAFQANMSNTSYQRAANDLAKAGLNRILAVGSGATTPGGATALVPDLGGSFSRGLSAASSAVSASSQSRLQSEQIKLIQDQATNQRADTDLKINQGQLAQSQAALNWANASQAAANTKNLGLQVPNLMAMPDFTKAQTNASRADAALKASQKTSTDKDVDIKTLPAIPGSVADAFLSSVRAARDRLFPSSARSASGFLDSVSNFMSDHFSRLRDLENLSRNPAQYRKEHDVKSKPDPYRNFRR